MAAIDLLDNELTVEIEGVAIILQGHHWRLAKMGPYGCSITYYNDRSGQIYFSEMVIDHLPPTTQTAIKAYINAHHRLTTND